MITFKLKPQESLSTPLLYENSNNFHHLVITFRLTLLALFFIYNMQAQSINKKVFANSGEFINNTNNQVNFTIGEPVIGVKASATNTLQQGFWSSVLSITLSEEDFAFENKASIQVFPNPVKDNLQIKFTNNASQDYQVFIFDIHGRKMKHIKINKGTTATQIKMIDLVSGTYVLNVLQNNSNKTITYKLIKK